MPQVDQDTALRLRIDHYLTYLSRDWQRAPEIAHTWNGWHPDEQLTFVNEWPIREDRLCQLAEWSNQDMLTATEQQRLDAIRTLVAQNRPVIDRLLNG